MDALSKKILLCQAENKRLKRKNGLLEMHRQQATVVIRELRQESDFRQALIHEIFNNHPEVHEEYVLPMLADEIAEGLDDEETEEETEWEREELEE